MGLMQFECVPSRSVVSGRMGAFDSHGVLIPALTHPVHGGLLMAGPRYAGRLLNFLAISLSMPRFLMLVNSAKMSAHAGWRILRDMRDMAAIGTTKPAIG